MPETELVPWRAEPAVPRVHAGTVRADRLRVRADYPVTGVALVLLVLQAVFLLPLVWQLDVTAVAVPALLGLDALGFGGLWLLRERARRDVGRLESSYADSERDGVTRDRSLAGLLAVSRERHEAIREEWTRALTDPLASLAPAAATDVADPDTAAFLESYAALEDFLAAHPRGVPPGLVAVYGEDVRECRRRWDAARARSG
ncbi:hypothetical protein [Nocardioides sp. zg-1228]|uniref:hypothetical protein n=1 Tax=Nocardioides sp. zg-1228 TaxID=2763008 RepID=UPI001642C881|nr:hypothetical protein [Nocardioides sp. zg-1228]MBC2932018.1 hypothetical protein [Nocardioides sp. zg-1228]QSF57571.1 hypothetical protein JX575_18910 [Nocardioides sp. zg-1228]